MLKSKIKAHYAPKKRNYNFKKKQTTLTTNNNAASKMSTDKTSSKKNEPKETASSSKIGNKTIPVTPEKSKSTTSTATSAPKIIHGYRFMDMSILASIFTMLNCPGCNGSRCLNLHEIDTKKKGLASSLVLQCSVCLYEHSFFTSKQYSTQTKGGAVLNFLTSMLDPFMLQDK